MFDTRSKFNDFLGLTIYISNPVTFPIFHDLYNPWFGADILSSQEPLAMPGSKNGKSIKLFYNSLLLSITLLFAFTVFI